MSSALATSILIVEDEGLLATDLQQSLLDFGYDASAIASSGEEALACVEHRCPDVVLMDIRIKGTLDGIQTAMLLKQRCSAIIIYLTAHADMAMIERAKNTAPQGYLVKPVNRAELRTTIEIALHNRQVAAEISKRQAVERRLRIISDNIPIAVAYFDAQGKVQFANQVFREIVPYQDNPIGKAASTVLGWPVYHQSYPARQRALLGETVGLMVDMEQDRAFRQHKVTYLPDHDAAGDVCGVYAISDHVTERRQLIAELRLARLDLDTLLNAVPASISSWQKDLTFRFANQTAKRQFVISHGALVGARMREVIGAGRFEQLTSPIEKALAGQDSSIELTEPGNGSTRYIRHYFVAQRQDDAVVGMYALAFDVTDLRNLQEETRRLAQRLATVREDEQRSVATILHDGLAQDLFAMKLHVDWLAASTPEDILTECRELSAVLAHCMEDTRQLAHSLRPAALTQLGIVAAIREHARHFSEHARLAINVWSDGSLPPLSDVAQLLLFRAAQEALTNIARHAKATKVAVKMWSDQEQIWLTITDDGVGIGANVSDKKGSLGLLALRERFTEQRGSVSLCPIHPTGTVVTFSLPHHYPSVAHVGADPADFLEAM